MNQQQPDLADLDLLNDLDLPDLGDLHLPQADTPDLTQLPIGRRVTYWRTERGLSQRLLADLIGMSKSWLEKVEGGARRLDSLSMICRIAEVLKIDPLLLLSHPARDRGAATHPPQPPAAVLDLSAARRDVDLLIYRHASTLPENTEHYRSVLTVAYAAMAAEAVPLAVRCKVIATVLSRYGGLRH